MPQLMASEALTMTMMMIALKQWSIMQCQLTKKKRNGGINADLNEGTKGTSYNDAAMANKEAETKTGVNA